MAKFALTLPVLAYTLLITLACSQSATIAKQSEQKTVFETPPLAVISLDVLPVFPGGDDGLMDYITRRVMYPASAQVQGIEGRVYISFVIDKDGTIKNVEVVKSLNPSCDKEAVRVIKGMPKWTPGQKAGVCVPVFYTIPIQFKLNRATNAY